MSEIEKRGCDCDRGRYRGPADREVTAWLVEEARDAGQQISALMLTDERVFATGFTLMGVAASIAVANGQAQLLMALPFFLAVLFCFAAYHNSQVMALGGYKSVLEEAIHHRTGVPVSAWETAIAPVLHRASGVRMIVWLLLVCYLASVFVALQQAIETTDAGVWGHDDSTIYIALTALSVLLGTLASAWAGIASVREFTRVAAVTRIKLLPQWIEETSDRTDDRPGTVIGRS